MGKSKGREIGAEDEVPESVAGRLWTISCKVRGLGELIRNRGGEPPLNESEVNYGIGEILTSLADDLDRIREEREG